MPSTYHFLDPKLTWRVKSVGNLVESDTDSEPSVIVYFESFDKHRIGAKRFDFSHHPVPLNLFRKLSVDTDIQKGRLVKPQVRAWITIDPNEFSEHVTPISPEPAKLVTELRKQLHLYYKSSAPHTSPRPAFFPYSSYLKIRREKFNLIIPCAELARFFFCPTARLTKAAFSPVLAKWIEIHKNSTTARNWTDKERQTLDFITSDIRAEIAARLPYKNILKTGIENYRNGLNKPPFILTRFPTKEKTVLLTSYETFPLGIKGLTKRKTFVVGTIYKSIEHNEWRHQQANEPPLPGTKRAYYMT